ncbi:MAG: bifunctional methylenetetrahydrofolate dehydrogenase/methenyltetrahydrofolate cyclohydrolase FolD [Chitinivibrionales bacterium]|nr:bifunctional methylenetetrahydrofolate dehydrogenase/methenyltetrahydrofolate cyclohydrolase FolD [Chitinivibrionales bacterium]MBD3395570.1 bifunctional methylenetetrahydrofolate dehydrogenase/methenyltetrahydrofolate cyclohydrolase FolD [Chitinivibrionales bacterium]
MALIDGKHVSAAVLEDLKAKVASLRDTHGITPGLAVVIVGDDPASQVYVRNKVKRATEIGMLSEKHELPADASQEEVLALVEKLNNDKRVHGILVQSPPPPQINERAVIETILPSKDVDCFHPVNVGKLLIGDEDGFVPCTPQGIMTLLAHYHIETAGKHAVVIGRSNIVGKPMGVLLSRKSTRANCTVTMCHSRTRDIPSLCRLADILVVAIGRAHFVTADMVKEGAVVIDVGMNRIEDSSKKSGYRLAGDVDFEHVSQKASYITPVPGGVGPMTIAMLLTNALKACCLAHNVAV